ncbi:MAG: DUF2958 domain-containing protein [Chloroflexi bacterium]|nr:DUF2958 domain-containing protein [Chloroflexota bacterium]MYD48295.1 DUF2958 domain-containing protein [Chloroflexota bacterium]
MTHENETAATMWRDHHSGKRGHQLMTEKLAAAIPALGANADVVDCDDIIAHAKLFSPYSGWTWYIAEYDPEAGQCFGLVAGLDTEMGYFNLTELAETTVAGGVPAVERDLYWEPRTLGEIKGGSRDDSLEREVTNQGETATDETSSETHSPDGLSAEEFLFGDAGGDNPTEADGQYPAANAADDAGDLATAEARDADTEAAEESDVADASGEPDTPAEAETPDELKVVLSIRAGRATIGVQRSAADPHIESFDDPDLFGLADLFPAVVARARARWEDEPQHPAYERPAPPARQRSRRQRGTAQPEIAGEGAEEEQPQPETLRLF